MAEYGQLKAGLILPGLDGANPLGFLAALGALRGLTLAWPERRVCLGWVAQDVWRPALAVGGAAPTQQTVLDGLAQFVQDQPGHEMLAIADDLSKITLEQFRLHAHTAAHVAGARPEARAMADFAAALGSDAVDGGENGIRDTALRTMSGAGHQHFLKSMRELAKVVTRDALQRCLFGPWTRQDHRLSLRWDPEDDRRYALQWRNPSSEETCTEWGANRLAFEALPLFPVVHSAGGVATTGFSGRSSRDTFWTWPIWEAPADLDTVRSLLALQEFQKGAPDRASLGAMGIGEVYRSQRLTVGKFRNFSPARPA